ncbi:MAG: hypothetical protein Kow00109_29000 [Acidobacteriota bacterium]
MRIAMVESILNACGSCDNADLVVPLGGEDIPVIRMQGVEHSGSESRMRVGGRKYETAKGEER